MQTTKDKFERTLARTLEEMINDLMHNLSNGHLSDLSDYKFIAGRIHGLRAALNAIEEVNSIIERG